MLFSVPRDGNQGFPSLGTDNSIEYAKCPSPGTENSQRNYLFSVLYGRKIAFSRHWFPSIGTENNTILSDRQFRSRFRLPHFTHHSANISTFLNSTVYFPHSAIPHFTNEYIILKIVQLLRIDLRPRSCLDCVITGFQTSKDTEPA